MLIYINAMTYHLSLNNKSLENQCQNKLKIDFVNNNL